MKNILREIADILYDIPKMNQNRMIGIMNPLSNEKQANYMLNYLKKNKNDSEAMRIDNLLRTALRIGDTI